MKNEFNHFFHVECDGFEHQLEELAEDFVDEYNSAVRSRKDMLENAKNQRNKGGRKNGRLGTIRGVKNK
jgi:secreted Zn-dependent insulinase-like peptidase